MKYNWYNFYLIQFLTDVFLIIVCMHESKKMSVYFYFTPKYYLTPILNIEEKNPRPTIFIFVCCLYVVEHNLQMDYQTFGDFSS